MALTAYMVWEVRPATGSDNNGGGFDPHSGTPGTDYSQQASPQVAFTDLVIGATTTQLTSVANPFSAADVGNIIQITSGTGFTTGFYQVMSVSGVTATMDRSVGTAASTGGHGNLGGALATVNTAINNAIAGNTIWMTGTQTITSAISLPTANSQARVVIEGYGSSRGDGTHATITCATNSVQGLNLVSGTCGYEFRYISFTCTAGTPGTGFSSRGSGNSTSIQFTFCTFDGWHYAGDTGINGTSFNIYWLAMIGCEIKNSVSHGLYVANPIFLSGCYFHGNGGAGILTDYPGSGDLAIATCVGCVFAANTSSGASLGPAFLVNMVQCVFYGNGASGLDVTAQSPFDPLIIQNCIFYGNTTYGINGHVLVTAPNLFSLRMQLICAFGGNGTDATSWGTSEPTDITLTGNPFNGAGSGDFSLNTTAGAGAACTGAGWQSPII